MGLIIGEKEIGSTAKYIISFYLDEQEFDMIGSVENPNIILSLAERLGNMGFSPKIKRIIRYNKDNDRQIFRNPDDEYLTLDRLREIVETNKLSPTKIAQVVKRNGDIFLVGDIEY